MDISYFFCPEHAQENFSFCFVKEKKNGVHHAGQPPGQAKRAARAHICRRIYIRSAPMDGWMHACVMLMAVPVRRCFFSHLHLQPKLATTTRRSS